MIFLCIYAIFNVLAFLFTFVFAVERDNEAGEIFLIYPQMWEKLDDYEVNLAGKVSACTLISLAFAPAIIAWYALDGVAVGACILAALAFNLFCKIFKKRSKK